MFESNAKLLLKARYMPLREYSRIRTAHIKRVTPRVHGLRGLVEESLAADMKYATSPFYKEDIGTRLYPPEMKVLVEGEQKNIANLIKERENEWRTVGLPKIFYGDFEGAWQGGRIARALMCAIIGSDQAVKAGNVFFRSMFGSDTDLITAAYLASVISVGLATRGLIRTLEFHRIRKESLAAFRRLKESYGDFITSTDEALAILPGEDGLCLIDREKMKARDAVKNIDRQMREDEVKVDAYLRLLRSMARVDKREFEKRFEGRLRNLEHPDSVSKLLDFISGNDLYGREFFSGIKDAFQKGKGEMDAFLFNSYIMKVEKLQERKDWFSR